ncbi:hypothetical protein AJ79_02713 [Helicocarpus griseus UAMH5409]|uniref:Potassium uptake protein n=1 Tax=Helicocarpus griseus UAMH5409 TaxID=1447875 RepID=A0A2B7Y1W0_9EURO|nr:hypothetical protein AJ79_02713 [Helicocarpus griseus UAMH5409]
MPQGYVPVDDDDNADTFDKSAAAHADDEDGDEDRDGDIVDGLGEEENDDDADVDAPWSRRNSIRFNRDYYGLSSADLAVHGSDHLHEYGKTELHGWASMWLAYQSIGAIYGDIGTSPLYVFSSTFPTPPALEDLVGVLSLIIWALILIATIKYVMVVLCANDKGEGGSFALFSLIRRYVDIDERSADISDFNQLGEGDEKRLRPFNSKAMNLLKRSSRAKRVVKVLAVLGVCMVISDGVLTPAQSILGAVQGIQIAAPETATHTVVAIACVLIVLLFALQPFGTSKLSSYFAPIVIVWLCFNVISGVYNLLAYDSSVLHAFSPWLGTHYLVRRGLDGWKSLGGVLLCFTGVEALFADLGAFSVKQGYTSLVALLCIPLLDPHLLRTSSFYLRQSRCDREPAVQIRPKRNLMSQAIRMGYLPKIRAVHTSKRISSQIYIPWANWLMMLAALVVTGVFKTTTKLGNAYGSCVVGVGFITTWLVALVSTIIWNVHVAIVMPIFLFFAVIDGLFVSAALYKVPSGGWFTVAMAAILSCTLLTWNYGEECQLEAERDDSSLARARVFADTSGTLFLHQASQNLAVKIIRGIGIFLVESDSNSPPVFDHFLRKFEASHEITVLLHIKHIPKYHIPSQDRIRVSETSIRSVYRVTLRIGYGDTISWQSFEQSLVDELEYLLSSTANSTTNTPPSEININIIPPEEDEPQSSSRPLSPAPVPAASSNDIPMSDLSSHIKRKHQHPQSAQLHLKSITQKPITYIIGRDKLYIKEESNFVRRAMLAVFVFVKNQQRTPLSQLKVPVDRLVEIGFSKAV